MRIAVLGATGFIGQVMVTALASAASGSSCVSNTGRLVVRRGKAITTSQARPTGVDPILHPCSPGLPLAPEIIVVEDFNNQVV